MLAAPEFVETEPVDLLDEIEVAAELEQGVLADRVMRGEEGSKLKARHGFSLRGFVFVGSLDPNYGLRGGNAIMESPQRDMVIDPAHIPPPGILAALGPKPEVHGNLTKLG
jgi:hypothetical protein